MAEQIGTYHLADNPELFEVSRSNNFELLVYGLENLLAAGVDADQAQPSDYITGGKDVVRLSVISCDVPHFDQDEIEIARGNTKMYAAGKPNFKEGTIEVNDFIGEGSKSLLMAWQRQSYDATTETIGEMKNYKKFAQLVEYDASFSKVLRTWEIHGCWVKGLSEPKYDYNEGGKRTITATLRYDYAIPRVETVEAE